MTQGLRGRGPRAGRPAGSARLLGPDHGLVGDGLLGRGQLGLRDQAESASGPPGPAISSDRKNSTYSFEARDDADMRP